MVYCGKASQGCQNCRTRRIKCDKVRPDCSQCIRVGKKCPGYRDQLSLMFRDESTKVMQKAHAQWGVPEGSESATPLVAAQSASYVLSPSAASSSSSTSSSGSECAALSPVSNRQPSISSPSSQQTQPSPAASTQSFNSVISLPVTSSISPTLDDQGTQFYISRYILGHPDEPKTPEELNSTEWVWNPALRDIMVAVGLAGVSNLKADEEMMSIARQRYGSALRQTSQLIQSADAPSLDVTMRAVIMLAMFELVKGSHRNTGGVSAHVMGAAALLRSWCPIPTTIDVTTFGGVRALIQLLYSMFIHSHVDGVPVVGNFVDWVTFTRPLLEPIDQPAVELGLLISRFVELSAFVRNHVVSDGRRWTTSALRQMLSLDTEFQEWDDGLTGSWRYHTKTASDLPPQAIFEGEYHVYHDLWFARMWNHYRWARILLNQMILDFASHNPMSSLPLLSVLEQDTRLQLIRRLSKDLLVSTPNHWRHPLLVDKNTAYFENPGGTGSGAAGVPVLLFHIRAAACAPGIPRTYWDWAQGIIECIWSDMGMLHAKSMLGSMTAYRDDMHSVHAEGILV